MPSALPRPAPRALTKIAAAGSTTTMAGLVRAATRLSRTPDLIRSRLDHIRSHPDRLSAIADQSYMHSNGFAKVRMLEGRDVCVRRHIWLAGSNRIGDVDPHGHRWEFASWIAVGPGMAETYFVDVGPDDPRAVAHVRYDYGREDGVGYLHPRGPVWLRSDRELRRSAGEVYRCPRDVLHTVAPIGDDLFVTVVLQGPVVSGPARVYRKPDQQAKAIERIIEPHELDRLFGDVDAAVRARRSA